jgi:hypothetical protein
MKLLREQMKEGYFDDLEHLLPPENLKLLEEGEAKRSPAKKSYEAVRMEKERAKIAAHLAAHPPAPRKVVSRPKIGPLTQEEYLDSLPRFGPKTRGEALLPVQRDQRQTLLNWLRRPWGQWDEEAAAIMDELHALAKRTMDKEARAARIGPKTREEAVADGQWM